ncbi:MAG: hypothetical protein IPH58_05470 [Sphingobacteriales bacterium]|jgi:hypothetical protein|nr:hypothetical protein [Sphingobacteriales bacterium]
MLITRTQNKILHSLLNQAALMPHKESLVQAYSNGRTGSSRELTATEANSLIHYLKGEANQRQAAALDAERDACNRMRRKIIAKAHLMQWQLPATQPNSKPRADMQRIDRWCLQYGGFGKPLNAHNRSELAKLVTRFDNMYRKFVKNIPT